MKFNFKKVLTVAAIGLSAGLLFNSSNDVFAASKGDSIVSIFNEAVNGLDITKKDDLARANEKLYQFNDNAENVYEMFDKELKNADMFYDMDINNRDGKLDLSSGKSLGIFELPDMNKNIYGFSACLVGSVLDENDTEFKKLKKILEDSAEKKGEKLDVTIDKYSNEEFKRLKKLIDGDSALKNNLKFIVTDSAVNEEIYRGDAGVLNDEGEGFRDFGFYTFGVISRDKLKPGVDKELKFDVVDGRTNEIIYSNKQVVNLKNLEKKQG